MEVLLGGVYGVILKAVYIKVIECAGRRVSKQSVRQVQELEGRERHFHLLRSSPDPKVHLRMLRLIASVLLLSLVAGSRCPDQQRCEEEQTCCQIRSGEFNCCPFHQGECCEDHLHCCPEGMLCEVKESSCTNATHSISWAERFPSEHSRIVKSYRMITSYDANNMYNTVCPDNSFCPWEFSCLKVSETYGCCPVAHGIVCSDGKHCCPSDRECTTDSTSCVEKTVSDVPCDDTAACPDGSTCCKDGLGGWGCCPLPQAVCCEDFIYCCPQGKKCNHETQSCDDPSGSVPWLKKVPSRPIDGQKFPETKLSDVPCDDTVGCPDGTTCCKDGKGGWGCCPLPQAVCCEDFTHCCPQGKKCNLTAQTCDDPFGSVPWLKKLPSRPIDGQKVPESKLSDVPCDDTVACPDGTTCCKDGKGGFGCCPFPQAVCCEDFIHCCPQGKKCNLAAQTCDDPFGSVPWLKKVPSRPIDVQKVPESKLSDVPCDDTVACPDGTTCCKDGKGGFGCCPFPQAVCCEDFIHCCPHGKKCNLAAQTCDDPFGSVPWLKKVPSRPIDGQKVPESKLSAVPCDDTVACPDGTTCCKDGKGGFGCCPFPQAVCCEDFTHCCPQGKKCNLAAQTCDDPFGSVPWLKKVPSRSIDGQKVPESNLSDVPCDDTVACPDGTTCCKDGKGGFGCCPFPQAVCCEDFIHCCPQGKKCNLAAQTCDDPFGSVPWLKKVQSRPIDGQKVPESKLSDVPCDDTVACPDGTTCCKDGKGGFGCCPFPQAVCCEDFIHCCPQGKKCNLAAQTCDDPFGSVPWLKKVPSRLIDGQKVPESNLSDVPCDDTVACPDGTTCCKDGKGGFGCCPFPQAVCCEDFIHCCPQGKKCNLAAQTCDDPFGSVPWLKKVPSRPIDGQKVPESKLSDVPCDDTVACPDGTTCCKDGKGGFGCCPFPQAVCCEDFTHCCPQGKKCNLAAQTCDDPFGSVPWLKKVPSRPIDGQKVPESKLSDVPCDDTVACPDGTTCCKDGKGGFGCCPFPQAVCCEDFTHCCPQGKKCNLAAQTCDDPFGSVPWLKKVPSRPIDGQKVPESKLSDVPCDDTVACPDGTTCCKDGKGGFGCCPFPQAVCCEDFIHCCPQGKKCNLAAQTCDDPFGSVPWLKKVPSRPIDGQKVPESKLSDVPCDDTVACPDGTTCCKDGKGGWGCCPFPQAVCCEDFIHCCPQGKKCNLAAQTCDDPYDLVPWLKKVPSRSIDGLKVPESKLSDVPCDDTVACPDGTTCCKDVKGGWGCCPFPEATCCEDGENCCPKGYVCRDQWCEKSSGIKFDSGKRETSPPQVQKNIDCGEGFRCRDTETCCRMSESSLGCCPFLKAVCCSDMQRCCPAGYTCDKSGSCTPVMGFNWDMFSKK